MAAASTGGGMYQRSRSGMIVLKALASVEEVGVPGPLRCSLHRGGSF
jgi:hypothetical protein